MSEPGSNLSEEGGDKQQPTLRKIRIRKLRPGSSNADATKSHEAEDAERALAMDRRIAELIPGIAELSVSSGALAGAVSTASDIRKKQISREDAHRAEVMELSNIYDMSIPNPAEFEAPAEPWKQELRPRVRKVQLSPYQYEMINYQRMLMRKNTWYYRDRMSIPRGPCPLHVLKDAWVQGCIDENTLVWGQGLFDWLPAKNVKLLLPMIRTPEVRLGAWMKRTFSLKPALNKIREARKEFRPSGDGNQSLQVELMR